MNCEVVINTKDLTREDWLKQRRNGIGGSDVGVICGLSKYKSPIALYLDKIGETPIEETESEAAYWGTTLEEVVAKEFTKRTGKKVQKKNAILRSVEYPFMFANVDRLIVGEKAGLECKTASEYMKNIWDGDEVPETYILQCMHYMIVTGLKKWYIAALIGGNKYVWKEIEYDQELADYVIAAEKEFWDRVQNKIPPVVDGSEASGDLLEKLHPEALVGTLIELPSEVDMLKDRRDQLIDAIDTLETEKNEIDNKIKQMLGENEKGQSSSWIITWGNRHKKSLDSKKLEKEQPQIYSQYLKETSYRQLAFKAIKK